MIVRSEKTITACDRYEESSANKLTTEAIERAKRMFYSQGLTPLPLGRNLPIKLNGTCILVMECAILHYSESERVKVK